MVLVGLGDYSHMKKGGISALLLGMHLPCDIRSLFTGMEAMAVFQLVQPRHVVLVRGAWRYKGLATG